MQLRDPLIDEPLRLAANRGHREVGVSHAFHQHGPLTWTLIKYLAMRGMARGQRRRHAEELRIEHLAAVAQHGDAQRRAAGGGTASG